jgi:hypothetical protein
VPRKQRAGSLDERERLEEAVPVKLAAEHFAPRLQRPHFQYPGEVLDVRAGAPHAQSHDEDVGGVELPAHWWGRK